MVYVVIADGVFDQICETLAQAKREKRDLEGMGFVVKIKPCVDWAAAEALEDKMKGY